MQCSSDTDTERSHDRNQLICIRAASVPVEACLHELRDSERPGITGGPQVPTCSVSTKLDTWPSSFTPRVWKRAPARSQLMREMRQALACLCDAYTVRMATTPQMTFSSQSQQLTWCCLRGTCNSWFLQNRTSCFDSGHPTASSKHGTHSRCGEAPWGWLPAQEEACPLWTCDLGVCRAGSSCAPDRPQTAGPLRHAQEEEARSPLPKPPGQQSWGVSQSGTVQGLHRGLRVDHSHHVV